MKQFPLKLEDFETWVIDYDTPDGVYRAYYIVNEDPAITKPELRGFGWKIYQDDTGCEINKLNGCEIHYFANCDYNDLLCDDDVDVGYDSGDEYIVEVCKVKTIEEAIHFINRIGHF